MLVMRPAQMADLNEVQRMAADSPIGVTSLPDDAGRLGDMRGAFEHTRQDVDAINHSAAELGETARALKSGLGAFRT